ncbi:MAG: deoxyhypusine synthase [Thermoplasmata archaeon]|nr:MAG: deoxyhypusine synthase [Thermoplasmata archaeon]HDJ27191.1 deoxyhypusine synthase [Aciduliprofundum sp.]
MRPVEDLELSEGLSVKDLVEAMGRAGGFMATHLAEGARILVEMIKDENAKVMLSFTANLVATGLRGVFRELVRRRLVDAVVTTAGTLDHDIARHFAKYYHGSFYLDDAELAEKGYHRLGNVLVPLRNYGPLLEEKLTPIFLEALEISDRWAPRDLIWHVGSKLGEDSILYWCSRHRIPVFVPGITDGAFGSQLWSFRQLHPEFVVDILRDEEYLADFVFEAGRLGALVVGGGISKHHTIWWAQFIDGLDYAVYVTTAPEWDGSLSGARPREAVSWGKLKKGAPSITVVGDATLILPLMVQYALEVLGWP